MAALDTLPARRAALLLHGLPSPARAHVMALLNRSEQARLQPLLDELTELDAPAWSFGVSAEAGLPSAASPSAQDEVVAWRADVLLGSLQGCAASTIALLLQARAWPWQSTVLEAMPRARRDDVAECMRTAAVLAPATLECLCERLRRQAAQAPSTPLPRPAATGWIGRMLSWKR